MKKKIAAGLLTSILILSAVLLLFGQGNSIYLYRFLQPVGGANATGSTIFYNTSNVAATYASVSWTVNGTLTGCTIQVNYSTNGTTVAGQLISSQTCTSNGSFIAGATSTPLYVQAAYTITPVGSGYLNFVVQGCLNSTCTAGSGGGGSGTVNAGTTPQLAYYASSTNAVSSDATLSDNGTVLTYIGSTGLVIPNGSGSAPSLAFASSATTGIYQSAANVMGIASSGAGDATFTVGMEVGSGALLKFSATAAPTGNSDTALSRDAAGVLDICGTNPCTSGSTTGKVKAAGYMSVGGTFTLSSNGCTATTLVGGATAGSVVSGTTGVCAFTVTMGNTATAPNGWACYANDLTTHTNTVLQQSTNATTAAFSGTTVSGDTINFGCIGY
jgi:hypothetical protein